MKVLFALLLMISIAHAQPATAVSPVQQALGQKLMEQLNVDIQLRTELLQVKAQIEELKKSCKPDEGK